MATLPNYITTGGEQAMPQPYAIEGISFYGFLLESDDAALSDFIGRSFPNTTAAGFQYRPLAPVVMLGLYSVAKNHSAAPAPDVGWMTSKEACFFVPVARIKLGPVELVESIAWWIPYIVVDNGWAMASGREVFCVRKEMGSVAIPPSAGPLNFSVETLTLETIGPDNQATMNRLITVTPQATSTVQKPTAWHTAGEAIRELLRAMSQYSGIPIPGKGLIKELWELWKDDTLPIASFKQFRDAGDYTKACYQEILESPAKVTDFSNGGFLWQDFTISIPPYQSHPLVTDMGLKGKTVNGIWQAEALAAMQSQFSFTLLNATSIWKSS